MFLQLICCLLALFSSHGWQFSGSSVRKCSMLSTSSSSSSSSSSDLETLKLEEHRLRTLLSSVSSQKREILKSRPLSIGIIGFGRFGQFMAETFVSSGAKVFASSRSDYTSEAKKLGVTFVPLDNVSKLSKLVDQVDVLVFSVSILSFEESVKNLAPMLINKNILVADVLSVKEHAKKIFLTHLPPSVDVLCTHPMFGPDSGKDSWRNLNFVFERTRVVDEGGEGGSGSGSGSDRAERFLSIFEEAGCQMTEMSCSEVSEPNPNPNPKPKPKPKPKRGIFLMKDKRSERANRAGSREMATDIMATSTTELTLFHPIRLAHFTRFARPSLKMRTQSRFASLGAARHLLGGQPVCDSSRWTNSRNAKDHLHPNQHQGFRECLESC